MTREDKKLKRKQHSLERALKNKERNKNRWKKSGRNDCPLDIEIYDKYGSCTCGGRNYNDCLGDI